MENKIVTLKIESNLDNITKDVKKLNSGLEDSTKEIKKVEKNVEKVEGATKSMADGFKATGLAIKAMGIGLLISAFSTLQEVFTSNQKVANTFSAVMGTMTNIFTQVVNILVSVVEKVNKSSNGFDNLGKVVSGMITLSLTPLKLVFYGISLAIDEAKLAWEESFFGDGDPKVIKKLSERITSTKDNIVEVGKAAIDAGIKVATNIGGAIKEVGAVVEGTIEGVSKISIRGAYEQAKANVQLQNSALIAAAEQAKLVEKYDTDAEKLRKIRDNDLLSIKDRTKANDDLKAVLENQSNAMKSLAAKQVEAAASTYNLNKSTENQVALINAQANALGVVAQIEGLTSEQEANRVSLKKELNDLDQTKLENINTLAIEQKKFNETLETDELKKLENQRLNLEEEKRIELERLQLKINGAAQGTQAKLDAENEYAIKTQEIDNALITNKKAIADEEIKIEKAKEDQKKAIQDAQFALASGAVNFLKEIGGKSKAIQKAAIIAENAIGIGKMIIANNAANIGALATPQAIASSGVSAAPVIAMNNITTALGVATTIAATAKALSAVGGGAAGSAGSVGGGMSGASVPKFNVVGASSTNQLAQTISSKEQQPIKTYVVAGDISTAQSLNRNIIQSASIG